MMRKNAGMNDFLKKAVLMLVILSVTLLFFAAGYLAADVFSKIVGRGVDVIDCASFFGLAGFICSMVFALR